MEIKVEPKTKFYPFTNQFTFSMVMRDLAICKGMLDRILPNENFGEVKNTNEFSDEELQQKCFFTVKMLILSLNIQI